MQSLSSCFKQSSVNILDMKLYLVIIFAFISYVSCFLPSDNNLGEYDCCPLVWKPLTQTPSGDNIPIDAVVATTIDPNYMGERMYFANVSGNIEFINASDTSTAYACLRDGDPPKYVIRDIYVLTNPYSCQLEWKQLWSNDDRKIIIYNNLRFYIPIFYDQYFVRFGWYSATEKT